MFNSSFFLLIWLIFQYFHAFFLLFTFLSFPKIHLILIDLSLFVSFFTHTPNSILYVLNTAFYLNCYWIFSYSSRILESASFCSVEKLFIELSIWLKGSFVSSLNHILTLKFKLFFLSWLLIICDIGITGYCCWLIGNSCCLSLIIEEVLIHQD